MRRHSLRLFRWHVLRYIARHRLLATLNVASVALGVAVYLAIQIAAHSAKNAFAATVDVIAGKAQLQVTSPAGNLRDELFPLVKSDPGIAAATPFVQGVVTLPDIPGAYLRLLGIDIFTNEPFRTFQIAGIEDIERWLAQPDAIALSDAFAREHGLKRGDALRVQVNGRTRVMTIAFLLRMEGTPAAAETNFAAMDIGWAQELLARRGLLSAIQLRLRDRESPESIARRLRSVLPPDVIVATPAQRTARVQNMLAGFHLNLTAMTLVSLLVGMFLIYNTVSASVVRRRRELGILRSLGATRGGVRALFLGEALALGTAGVLVGIAGGFLLARLLIGKVTDTISSVYVLVSVRKIIATPGMCLSAAGLGILSVLAAAWLPANAAAQMPPVRALNGGSLVEQAVRLSRAWMICGCISLVLAAALSWFALATGPPWLGFGAAFFVLAGFSFLVPEAAARFSALLREAFRKRAVEIHIAAANLGRALLRNAMTIAALAAAVAMSIGVSVMVFSFRQTVSSWIDQTLVADLFIAPASNEITGPTSFMPAEAIRFLETQPSVAAVSTFREVDVPFRETIARLVVIGGARTRRLRFVSGTSREGSVVVSESFARRHRVRAGDAVKLSTPVGVVAFPVSGVFYDYTRDEGVVQMSAGAFAKLWNDDRVTSVGVYLANPAGSAGLTSSFRSQFSAQGEFAIFSNRSLRARVFEVFDQTFAVTHLLRTIAVIVALVGIFLTLTTLVTERARDLGVLRALGASAAQVRRLLLWEAAMIGLLASVVGLLSGVCLSGVLTGVINRAFFGWTIQLAFPWRTLAMTPLWIIPTAIAAAWLPAWRAGRMVIADAVRNE